MRKLLLDTGPLVALLDRSEKSHEVCVSVLRSFSGVLLTTEPVITEAMYLLNENVVYQRACVDFLVAAEVQIFPASYASLQRAVALMETYRNMPMDFADATLVVLAEESGVHEIFTLDRRGFDTYRLPKKGHFFIVP